VQRGEDRGKRKWESAIADVKGASCWSKERGKKVHMTYRSSSWKSSVTPKKILGVFGTDSGGFRGGEGGGSNGMSDKMIELHGPATNGRNRPLPPVEKENRKGGKKKRKQGNTGRPIQEKRQGTEIRGGEQTTRMPRQTWGGGDVWGGVGVKYFPRRSGREKRKRAMEKNLPCRELLSLQNST